MELTDVVSSSGVPVGGIQGATSPGSGERLDGPAADHAPAVIFDWLRTPISERDVTERRLTTPIESVKHGSDLTSLIDVPFIAGGVVNGAQRRAATEEHQRAITTINDMFDRLDELVATRDRLTGVAPLGPHDDPIRDAESLLHYAELLSQALTDLRLSAVAASAHRRRRDLAADVGTKATSLFPRAGRDPESTGPMDDDNDPAPEAPVYAGRDALQDSAEPAAE